MTTLTARHVRTPRRRYACDWCGKAIEGHHIYLYGMADIGQTPFPLRLHIQCVQGGKDAKIKALLATIECEVNQ